MEHTTGKWETDAFWVMCGEQTVADCAQPNTYGEAEAEANARRIVKCVNAHYGLVDALKGLCSVITNEPNDYPDMQAWRQVGDKVRAAHDAIAEAEVEL